MALRVGRSGKQMPTKHGKRPFLRFFCYFGLVFKKLILIKPEYVAMQYDEKVS